MTDTASLAERIAHRSVEQPLLLSEADFDLIVEALLLQPPATAPVVTEERVERAAKILANNDQVFSLDGWKEYLTVAEAALTAALAVPADKGGAR